MSTGTLIKGSSIEDLSSTEKSTEDLSSIEKSTENNTSSGNTSKKKLKKQILVTGGAGYIGSVVVEMLIDSGYDVLVLDNLSTGHGAAVHPKATLVVADIGDIEILKSIFTMYHIDTVIHMAAISTIEDAIKRPGKTFETNLVNGLMLLEGMRQYNVKSIIFSSSAAVYGEGTSKPFTEEDDTKPVNFYGETKLAFERNLEWRAACSDFTYTIFRFFNAAGASDNYGEDHLPETHLIPNVIRAVTDNKPVTVFGNDYDTPDGTCIRDYLHVVDIARAHLIALKNKKQAQNMTFNLGSGIGSSILEVIEKANKVILPDRRKPYPNQIEYAARRQGDPTILLADIDKAKNILGWEPKYSLEKIISSAVKWSKNFPEGYGKNHIPASCK